jgi:hypothetical protein
MKSGLNATLRLLAALVLLTVSCNVLTPSNLPSATLPAPTAAGAEKPTATPAAAQGAEAPTSAASTPLPAAPVSAPLHLNIAAPTGSAAEAAQKLAAALAQAKSADEAAPVLADIFTWAGVAVYDSTGKRINAPLAPAAQLHLFDFQVYGLAVDYLNQGGMTLDELTQALTETQTTVNDQPISAARLQRFFSQWTAGAQKADPASWETFIPTFLHALNLVKSPAIDLVYSGYDANDLRLSDLELALFAVAHTRDGSPAPDSLGLSASAFKQTTFALQSNACDEWNQAQESNFGKWGSDAATFASGKAVETAWELATDVAGKVVGTAMHFGGKGFGFLLTAISALAGMTAWEFSIKADPNPAHYKHDQAGDVTADFIATIHINEKWPKWFADCLKAIGTEMPSNDDLSSNIIRWVPIHNLPPHADVLVDNQNGRLEQHFSQAGEARLKVKLWPEKNEDWKTAPINHDHMTVRGELYRDNGLPGAEVLVAAAAGDIPAAVLPVLKKWYDKWFPKKAWGVMNVDYHKIVPMVFHDEGNSNGLNWKATGYNCEGIYGAWKITVTADESVQGMQVGLNGKLDGQLPKDADQGTLTGNIDMSITTAGAPIAGGLSAAMNGTLKLGGTVDAPVMVIQMGDLKGGSATGQGTGEKITMPLQGPGGAPYGVAIKPEPDYRACK